MDSVKLNNLNTTFKVDDRHGHTVLLISSLVIISHQQGQVLPPIRLQVIDQKELGLYSALISDLSEDYNPEVKVDKQFAIFNYLKIEVIAMEPGLEYEVEVYFSLLQSAIN